jgi:hypothetical protein
LIGDLVFIGLSGWSGDSKVRENRTCKTKILTIKKNFIHQIKKIKKKLEAVMINCANKFSKIDILAN